MHRHHAEGRSPVPALSRILVVILASALLLWVCAPASAQLVDNGTFDDSLRCTGVFVDGVDANDALNVREGPGTIYSVVLTLAPAAPAIATGLTSTVGSSIWYQIGIGDCEAVGWVNSSFLGLDDSSAVTSVPATDVPDTTLAPEGGGEAESTLPSVIDDLSPEIESDPGGELTLSTLASVLLGLGVLGLATGVTMFVRGKPTARDEGPPPGMVGPPGGPYFLARVDRRTAEPRTITVGGTSTEAQTRRSDDLPSGAADGPVSAYPSLPDMASEVEAATDNIHRPAVRFFDTNSLGAGNGAEDESSG